MFDKSKAQFARFDNAHSFNGFLKLVANSLEEYEALCPDKIEDLDF